MKSEECHDNEEIRASWKRWKIAAALGHRNGSCGVIYRRNSMGMSQRICSMRREETVVLSTALVATRGQEGARVMSYPQSSIANNPFHYPDARSGGISKGVRRSRLAVLNRVAGRQEGPLGQALGRLRTFVKTRKKTAGCALAAIAGLIWFMAPLGKSVTLSDLLAEQGYWETVPPAEYYLPGTINTIEVRSDGRIAIYPTCKIDPDLLNKLTLQAHTVDRTWAGRLSKKFVMMDWIRELLPIEIEGDKAKSFNLSLRNSTILQISDEELLQVQREVVKGSCLEAIEISINSGATVCQTRAAMRGDLVYDITYESGGSVRVKDTGSSSLQVEPKEGNSDRVVGQGLIYGVNFAPHGIVFNTPDAKPADCRVDAKKKARAT
jgi:hypothetical protein